MPADVFLCAHYQFSPRRRTACKPRGHHDAGIPRPGSRRARLASFRVRKPNLGTFAGDHGHRDASIPRKPVANLISERSLRRTGFTHGIVATLVGPGVAQGAGGWVIIGGKIVKVPPRGPKYALLQAMAALDAAEEIDHPLGQKVVQHTVEAIAGIAKDLAKGKSI